MEELTDKAWASSWEDVVSALGVSINEGLGSADVRKMRKRYGRNTLREIKPVGAWTILVNQFKNLIVIFLLAASILSFAFHEYVEGIAIAAVIAINAILGFVTELKGVRSIEALRKLGSVSSRVRRDGNLIEVSAKELVPGDVVVLEGGDIITADLRLVKASKLQADESVLTGESVPVGKETDPVDEGSPLAERKNMLYKGTALTRGSGEAVVVATGMNTELGRISSLVEEIEDEITPLEKRLRQLGHCLIWVTLIIAALVAVLGIFSGKEVFLMIETAIALAVAAIPEGLPIVATIALARGVWRMAKRNALIKQLSAVETLGATNVICTDKTGTLTENRMTLTHISLASGEVELSTKSHSDEGFFTRNGEAYDLSQDKVLREALEVGVLCNNAYYRRDESGGEYKSVGDPLEVALLAAASKAGIGQEELVDKMPEAREEAFDSETKMMATYNKVGDEFRVAVKGAPEFVLQACSAILTEKDEREMTDDDRKRWLEHNDKMAENGLRVLALATKVVSDVDAEAYKDLKFIGLAGLLDPPRTDVKQSIDMCQDAGIRVIMVTGDQPVTARTIGVAVGLVDDENAEVVHGRDLKHAEDMSEDEQQRLLKVPLFARVSPKQKLDLIEIHQKNGSIVAMTGDGVNDAPALKKADIGIAMGLRGTQVAREAAKMVLKDDAFSSIVLAVEQGRIIFDNIRKFVVYLLSCNISEVMTVALASLVNAPLPILPLQILFLNIVTDVFPALALAAGEGSSGVMKRPPRDPKEPIMARRHWLSVGGYGFVITVSVLGAFAMSLLWLKMDQKQAVTVSFLTLAFAQLWHVFNMRDRGSGVFKNDITRNSFVWGALALCTGLLVAAVYLPGLSYVLRVCHPGLTGWILVIVMSLIPLVIGQALKVRGDAKA